MILPEYAGMYSRQLALTLALVALGSSSALKKPEESTKALRYLRRHLTSDELNQPLAKRILSEDSVSEVLEQRETGSNKEASKIISRGKNDGSTRVDKTQWQESKMTTQQEE